MTSRTAKFLDTDFYGQFWNLLYLISETNETRTSSYLSKIIFRVQTYPNSELVCLMIWSAVLSTF